jgi:hypothetical protein
MYIHSRTTMTYSRANPSPRYVQLLTMYREMHLNGERFMGIPARETFNGRSLRAQAQRIKRLIDKTGATTVLDYGSGKGQQYDPKPLPIQGEGTWDEVLDYWGVDEVVCFDPAYPPYSNPPSERFDGVVSTDVLEHCPEEDIPWIVDEIFSFAQRFVFATIACYPARKRLPNGENAHITLREPEWWRAILDEAAARHGGVTWEAWVQARAPNGAEVPEARLGN